MSGNMHLENISVTYGTRPVLRNLSLEIASETITVIKGRSGSGKSTFLEILAGLRNPDRGTVKWDGVALGTLSRQELLCRRHKIGYMFQQHALITNYSVFDNIALPLRTMGIYTEREISFRVKALLEEVALFGVETFFPEALSTGQQKSASLARALVADPDILMLDEPVSGVDEQNASGILAVIEAAQLVRKKTIILMIHDTISDKPLFACTHVLEAGRVVPCCSGVKDVAEV